MTTPLFRAFFALRAFLASRVAWTPGLSPSPRDLGKRLVTLGALAALAVGPLSGCSLLGSSDDDNNSGSSTQSRDDSESAEGWSIYLQGEAPQPPPAAVAPPAAEDAPLEAPPLTGAEATVPCTTWMYAGRMDELTAVPGAGSATVSWMDVAGGVVTEYRVAAVSQDLGSGVTPDPVWITVAPTGRCELISATVTGLTSGGRYVLWVDAVMTLSGREYMIGRSRGFTVG
ncbi:MAG: fibronectin type III domain-containing protein [Micromonosporaceae bacterium]|nr:fibronectin type III domain-containing protein [Micromonosporaceae bacterium]